MSDVIPEVAGSGERGVVLELTECWQGVNDAEDYDTIAGELEGIKEITAKAAQLVTEPEDSSGGRKSVRKAKSASQ